MSGGIQLVHVAQIRQAFARLFQGEVGVEISVGLLGGGNLGDDLVDRLLQLGIGMGGQRIRGPFQHLVDVRIVEHEPLELALHEFGGLGEVVDPSGPPAPLDVVRQRFVRFISILGVQNSIVQFHVGKRHAGKRPWLRHVAGRNNAGNEQQKWHYEIVGNSFQGSFLFLWNACCEDIQTQPAGNGGNARRPSWQDNHNIRDIADRCNRP